jgi:hypothetical protein
MARFNEYGRLDSAPVQDGDSGFVGVNLRDHPAALRPGEVARARNARFTRNEAEPRLGFAILPFANRVVSGATNPTPWHNVYGAETFRDPNGIEWSIVAADGKVWRFREGMGPVEIPLPSGVSITSNVTFTQTYNGFVMFRGEDADELYLDDIDAGFRTIQQEANEVSGAGTENESDGTYPIPAANNGDWISNRLFIPVGDYLQISDYLNATRYAGVRAQARINEGSSDKLVRFFRFSDNVGIAFKQQSIYVLQNIVADLSEMSQSELTREYGLAAARTCINTGADVWFLAEKRGICSIRLTEQNKLQGVDVPVSAEIQSLIDRIDWRNAVNACAAFHDNKAYFAVPLDEARNVGGNLVPTSATFNGSGAYTLYLIPGRRYQFTLASGSTSLVNGSETLTVSGEFTAQGVSVVLNGTISATVASAVQPIYENVNNAVLVYDFLKQKWAGYDTGTGVMVQGYFKMPYLGARRLFAWCADGFVKLVEELFYDEAGVCAGASVLARGAQTYNGSGAYTLSGLTAGRSYYWLKGANDTSLVNGTETLSTSGLFIAQGTSATLNGTNSASVTAAVISLSWSIAIEWIDFDVVTRGYRCGSEMVKRFLAGELQLSSWYPTYSVSLLTEGANEETTVAEDETKSASEYYRPAFAAAYDTSNVNDDHATAWRQDYSVTIGETQTANGSIQAGLLYLFEDLDHPGAQIVYNGQVLTSPCTFTGVAGHTSYLSDANLVAYWKMEEASSATRNDSKGTNHLTNNGTVAQIAGKLGNAAGFDNSADVLTCADNAVLSMGDVDMTLGGWFYWDAITNAVLAGKALSAGGANQDYTLACSGGVIQFRVNPTGSETIVSSGITPQTGQWYFIVGWHDAANDLIGIEVRDSSGNTLASVTTPHAGGINDGAANFEVSYSLSPFSGRVDNLFLYKGKVLSAGERTALYNGGAGVAIPINSAITPAIYGPGNYVFLGANGIDFDLHQQSTEELNFRNHAVRGRMCQLRLTSSRGRVALQAFNLNANLWHQSAGTLA